MKSNKKINITKVSRRSFLKTTGLATGGLLLQGFYLPLGEDNSVAQITLNAFVKIDKDNQVTLVSHQAEMGQGIRTTLPAILADELDADWNKVSIERGLTDPAFQNPKFKFQFTGNAESVRAFHDVLRMTAATAREMLKEAAALEWKVSVNDLTTNNSYIFLKGTTKKAPYGDFAEKANTLKPPKNPPLKKPSEWKLVGNKSLPRVDIPDKVTGRAEFGIDVERPGMVYAAIEMCPYFGGKIKEIKENNVRNMPGFVDLVRMPITNPVVAYRPGFPKKEGVVVVAKSYWQARKALDAITIIYDSGPNSKMDSNSLYNTYEKKMSGSEWFETLNEGNSEAIINASENTHEAQYYSAWQSHATMEPMNATAEVKGNKVEVWAPTQGQEMAEILVSQEFGFAKENITINRTYLGGGFGRRLLADYIYQAVFVAQKIQKPVKLLWSRENDMQHDFYRPGVMQNLKASLNKEGYPIALDLKLVSPSVIQAATAYAHVYEGEDFSIIEGAKETPYHFPNYRMRTHLLRIPPPASVWRTTGYGPNVFAVECFIDELASKNNIDPIIYRKKLLIEKRSKTVLDAVAKASNWYGTKKKDHYHGVAITHSFESFVAQVVEISIDSYGILDIHQITTAIDCGTVLDVGISKASIESGIVWGLTAALTSEINFKNGRTAESNFNDYNILAMAEFNPKIETVFVNSGEKIGGIAESGPICTAPALCNAIFAATGERFRSLPLKKQGIYTRYYSEFLPISQKPIKKFTAL